MYQIFEIDPVDGEDRLSVPDPDVTIATMCALLDTVHLVVQRTPRLDLLIWIDGAGWDRSREANHRASAVAREVFQAPAAAVCGPLLVTGGTMEHPAALDEQQAREAFDYLFGADVADRADGA